MRNGPVVIANAGGFWGDDPTAARRQVEGGPIDYLVMDYLAEVTMAILQKQKQRDPRAGYARDILDQLEDVLVPCLERGITVITNAGGVSPLACRDAVEALADKLGVADRLRVGVIVGDDLYDDLDGLLADGEELRHLDTGQSLEAVRATVRSANAYLGAAPIVEALRLGANVVIAGRVTDTAVTLAPLMYEFGWAPDDWDRLAAGIVAGHIIECGPQCTGGNFTDWHTVETFVDIGYPLIEAHPDGSFVVTKHPGTGGMVNGQTVAEQVLYELGGPRYVSPDCVARFDSFRLSEDGPDRVRVSGIRGEPAPETLKVAVSHADGYRVTGRIMIAGPNAPAKAAKAAEIFWAAAGGQDAYEETLTQFIGWDACHPPLGDYEPEEILLQVAARDRDRQRLESDFAPFVVGTGLGSVPGFCVPADQGRPRASEVVAHWPALISRARLHVGVVMGDCRHSVDLSLPSDQQASVGFESEPTSPADVPAAGETVTVPLVRLCLGRSGDKGDTCNVGVIARSPQIYAWMTEALTPEVIRAHYGPVCAGPVERHEFPNLLALNFLLHNSLGGGGTSSIRFDAQGKTYAQYLLAMPVDVPATLLPPPS
jgi:hypothetical protein